MAQQELLQTAPGHQLEIFNQTFKQRIKILVFERPQRQPGGLTDARGKVRQIEFRSTGDRHQHRAARRAPAIEGIEQRPLGFRLEGQALQAVDDGAVRCAIANTRWVEQCCCTGCASRDVADPMALFAPFMIQRQCKVTLAAACRTSQQIPLAVTRAMPQRSDQRAICAGNEIVEAKPTRRR